MLMAIDAGRFEQARSMFAAGHGPSAVRDATGISLTTLARRFPAASRRQQPPPGEPAGDDAGVRDPSPAGKPSPDPLPRARPRAGGRKGRPSDEQLEGMVRKVAKAPAIPAMLWLHCPFCATHFQTSAGPLAAELVEVSHDDRDLREILEWCYTSWKRYAWAGMLISWMGVPLLHHAAPGGLYQVAGPLMGMPPREPRDHRQHQHPRPAPPATPGPAPAPVDVPFAQQLAGMDLDQLVNLAAGLGVNLPPDVFSPDVIAAAGNLTGNGAAPKAAPVDASELTFEQQEDDLAALAAEAAAAQAAALAADPDAV